MLYMTEAIDEYAINALPEFEGKKFQVSDTILLDEHLFYCLKRSPSTFKFEFTLN